MGEGLISSGALYCNGELLGAPESVNIDLTEYADMKIELNETAEITVKIDSKMWRKLLGYISQKRFRKLLYSIGYGRNAVNEIIKFEWHCKGCYNLEDVKYWKEQLNEKN